MNNYVVVTDVGRFNVVSTSVESDDLNVVFSTNGVPVARFKSWVCWYGSESCTIV